MENLESGNNNNLTQEKEGEVSHEEDFAELVESSFHTIQEGEVVTGVVVQIAAERCGLKI